MYPNLEKYLEEKWTEFQKLCQKKVYKMSDLYLEFPDLKYTPLSLSSNPERASEHLKSELGNWKNLNELESRVKNMSPQEKKDEDLPQFLNALGPLS